MVLVQTQKGTRPSNGWPVFLFLHGFGDFGGSYVAQTEAAAKKGYMGIAPSGPVVIREGRHGWPADNFAVTHEYLQVILNRQQETESIDRSRVFLCGFSQGATHAVGLLVSWPEEYHGAVALSPGDGPPIPLAMKSTPCPRPLCVVYGQKEYRVFRKRAQRIAAMWRRAKWPCLLETHSGSHHFPENWDSRFVGIVQWLEGFGPAS